MGGSRSSARSTSYSSTLGRPAVGRKFRHISAANAFLYIPELPSVIRRTGLSVADSRFTRPGC
jgi:hypothetical protein